MPTTANPTRLDLDAHKLAVLLVKEVDPEFRLAQDGLDITGQFVPVKQGRR